MGRSTFYQYDELDRLILEKTDDPGFEQLIAAIEYDFSLGGRLRAQSFGTIVSSEAGGGAGLGAPAASNPITDEYHYTLCDCPDRTSLDCYGYKAVHENYSNNPDGSMSGMTGADGGVADFDYGPQSPPVRQSLSGSSGQGGGLSFGSTPGTNDTLYLYNSRNELIAMRDGDGVLTRYEYDARGRQVRVLTGAGSGSQNIYNDAGNLVASIDGEGRTTHFSYDDAGRLRSSLAPGNSTPTIYEYDSAGNLRTVEDPLGNTEEYVYDERFRLTEMIDANDDSTTFTYHADNQRHTLTDANDNTTTWTHDNAGRVHAETNELGHTRTYIYDEFNRLAEVTDRNGRIVRYIYDGRFLISEQWLVNSTSTTPVREIFFEYRNSPVYPNGTSGQISAISDSGQDDASAADDIVYH